MEKKDVGNKALQLQQFIKDAELAHKSGDLLNAEAFYTNAIELSIANPSLYGNRSAIRTQLQKYNEAAVDARTSLQIDPTYAQGHFCAGVALRHLGQFNSSLTSFAQGMSLDTKNVKYLEALISTALQSPLKYSLEPVMKQLSEMKLEKNPFVITSVIGQDLLTHNDAQSAVKVLECAIKIGTSSLKLRGSVFSALGSALWSLAKYDRAIHYMSEDLKASEELHDDAGEYRSHGNLAAALYHQGRLDEALDAHSKQLIIAEKLNNRQWLAASHGGIGMVCSKKNDLDKALRHHNESARLWANTGDTDKQCKELGKVGLVLLSLGDAPKAYKCQKDRLCLCTNRQQELQVYSDIAAIYRTMGETLKEIKCLQKCVVLSQECKDVSGEIKVLLLLGYTARHCGETSIALKAYQRAFEIAIETRNLELEGRACANLGILHHQVSNYEAALKFQSRCLEITIKIGDTGGQGRAHGNIGNAYSASGLYEQAIMHHVKELKISNTIGDRESECSTHGNLAVAYQALHNFDKAVHHYKCQYELAKEIGNSLNEGRALMNLGNFYNTLSQYCQAISFYRKYLDLCDGNSDKCGEGRALYNLGFAYFSLHEFQESVVCYEKSVAVATNCQDKVAMARAYCNLGLAKKSLGEYEAAFDCQRMFLSLSTELKSTRGTFKAFGNLGDIYAAMKEPEQALCFYQQQLALSEQQEDPSLIAQACTSLGTALRALGRSEQAVEMHSREVSIYGSILKDVKNEYKAQGRLGGTLTTLERFKEAVVCYQRQLELGRSSKEPLSEAQAWANLAISYTNLREFGKAKDSFESQIDVLESINSKSLRLEKCRAYCSIGECCEALSLYKRAVDYHQMALSLSTELKKPSLVERACKGLSNTLQHLGNPNSALVYAEQRLKVCEKIGDPKLIAVANGALGFLFSLVKKFKDALYCLNKQMQISVERNDNEAKCDAACGLGNVYALMGEHQKALEFHKLDLEIAIRENNRPCQGRAYGNLGAVYEREGDFVSAVASQEQHLFIAKEQDDEDAKLTALRSIGRNCLQLPDPDHSRAVLLLQQAILLSHNSSNTTESVAVVYDLGIATWANGDPGASIPLFMEAAESAESLCRVEFARFAIDMTSSLFGGAYELLAKCYSSLVCVLCDTGQGREALGVAERAKTFPARLFSDKDKTALPCVSVEKMATYASEHQSVVVYYHVTAGYLFQWVIPPQGELVYAGAIGLLDQSEYVLPRIIRALHDVLGIVTNDETANDYCAFQNQKFSSNLPFHQILQVQAVLHRSSKHITTGKGCLLSGSKYYHDFAKFNPRQPIYAFYEMLLSKVETFLHSFTKQNYLPKLVLVADEELLQVPFVMLKKRSTDHYLSQDFVIHVVPSFLHLEQKHSRVHSSYGRGLVVGNPELPERFNDLWESSSASEQEANMVARLLRVESHSGIYKDVAMEMLESSEIAHFACRILPGPLPGVVVGNLSQDSLNDALLSSPDLDNPGESPLNPVTHVLTAHDATSVDLSNMKLAVFGAPYLYQSGADTLSLSDSIFHLTKCFFNSGLKSILFALWPVPEIASKLFFQTFYKYLLDGRSSTAALAVAMETLRGNQQFEHPSYWAAFSLYGQDIRLDMDDLSMTYALREVIQGQFSRDAITLALHLHQKAVSSQSPPLKDSAISVYASQESVASRLHNTRGWRSLFSAVGLELRSSSDGLPDAIFFRPCSSELTQALTPYLRLPGPIMDCLAKLVSSPSSASSLGKWIKSTLLSTDSSVLDAVYEGKVRNSFAIDKKLWQVDGASQLLDVLGLLVSDASADDVVLYVRPNVQSQVAKCTVSCMNTLFGKLEEDFKTPSSLFIPGRSTDSEASVAPHNNSFPTVPPEATCRSRDLPSQMKLPFHSNLPHMGFHSNPPHIGFDDSFRSVPSEVGSNQQDVTEPNRNDFGVLPLDEPKLFTQTPKSTGLIVPKPVMAQQSDSAAMTGPDVDLSLKLGPGSSIHGAPGPTNNNESCQVPSLKSYAGCYHGNHNPKLGPVAKVCVVNPQQERTRTVEDKYINVFEGMLKDGARGQEELKQEPKMQSINKDLSWRSEVALPESLETYRPGQSAASRWRQRAIQPEYIGIVNKFDRVSLDASEEVFGSSGPDQPNRVDSVSATSPRQNAIPSNNNFSNQLSTGPEIFHHLKALNLGGHDERVQFV